MKHKAKCTYCISQMCNIYPDRRKNPIQTDGKESLIVLDTEREWDYVESINHYMHYAYILLKDLEEFIEIEKS